MKLIIALLGMLSMTALFGAGGVSLTPAVSPLSDSFVTPQDSTTTGYYDVNVPADRWAKVTGVSSMSSCEITQEPYWIGVSWDFAGGVRSAVGVWTEEYLYSATPNEVMPVPTRAGYGYTGFFGLGVAGGVVHLQAQWR